MNIFGPFKEQFLQYSSKKQFFPNSSKYCNYKQIS